MKKTFGKVISLSLAAVMLLSVAMMGVTAFAATEYTQDNYRYTVSGGEATLTKAVSVSGDVVIPDTLGGYSVTAIGAAAFANCTQLTGVTMPESVKSIGNSAFENCNALEEFTVPAGVTSVGESVFRSCTSLEKIDVENGNTAYTTDETGVLFTKDKTKIVSYPAGNGRVEYVIPAYVKEVERYAFAGSAYIEEVIWNNPDIKFGIGAFSNCISLARVTIPEGTKGLSDWLFNACYSLTEVNLPESLEVISGGAFHWCPSLESIELPSGLRYIRDNAFNECYSLKKVVLPEGLEGIYPKAFEKCYSLESIYIPDSVTYIGQMAFYQCFALKEIRIPGRVDILNNATLRYCYDLSNVTLSDSVKVIGDEAFMDAKSLRTITIPENVNTVTGRAFINCIAFESVVVDSDNAYFTAGRNGILFNKNNTKLVCFPANKADKIYNVPESVTEIGAYAFCSAQNLAAVVIPESVTSIEAAAFYSDNIRDIYFEGTQEQWNSFAVATDTATPVKAAVHFNHKSTDHVHEYAQSITDAPDCSGNGTKIYTCTCGENTEVSYHYVGSSRKMCDGGNYEWIDVKTPDCSAMGEKYYCCDKCGFKFWDCAVAKLPHDVKITVASSSVEYECNDCDYTHSETIPSGSKYIHYKSEEKERVHIYGVGEQIVVPSPPEKEDLTFFGWTDENGEIAQLGTMPDENLILTASYGTILEESSFGLTATFDEGCFDEDVKLSVKETDGISDPGGIYIPEGETYIPLGVFEIKMVNDKDQPVQPNEGKTVKLRFPIPEGYTENDEFLITHWFIEGKREQFSNVDKGPKIGKAIVEDGHIIIEISKFSEFAIHAKSRAKVTRLPSKTSYYYRENINLSGIELEVMKPDGTFEKVTDTSKMTVRGYDYSKVGTQSVTVEYEENTVSFEVNISYAWWQWIIRILFLGIFWY